jgi:hypothetical protein
MAAPNDITRGSDSSPSNAIILIFVAQDHMTVLLKHRTFSGENSVLAARLAVKIVR